MRERVTGFGLGFTRSGAGTVSGTASMLSVVFVAVNVSDCARGRLKIGRRLEACPTCWSEKSSAGKSSSAGAAICESTMPLTGFGLGFTRSGAGTVSGTASMLSVVCRLKIGRRLEACPTCWSEKSSSGKSSSACRNAEPNLAASSLVCGKGTGAPEGDAGAP